MSDAPFGTPGYTPQHTVTDPRYQAAAAQAVGQVQATDQGTDAGESVQAMQDQAVRAAMSDYETKLKRMMEAAEQQNSAWAKQFDSMQRQLASVQAQAGPPTATLLAASLATRVDSIAKAHPDLGGTHFAGLRSQAESLAAEVKDLAGGNGDANRVEQLANGVISWFERVHPRASGKFLEGAHAAIDEAERIIEELPKLVGPAVAIASAL
jgi:hypothetical protein